MKEEQKLELYKKVEEFVEESFDNAKNAVADSRKNHSYRVVERLKELCPNADEAMLIAAISHDIDGAFRVPTPGKIKSFNTPEYRFDHQNNSAKIITDFLKMNSADEPMRKRVFHLVSGHEDGGDEDQNLLKDADSLGYFDEFSDFFSLFKGEKSERIMGKTEYMYSRISSKSAKLLAKPLYERALQTIREYKA